MILCGVGSARSFPRWESSPRWNQAAPFGENGTVTESATRDSPPPRISVLLAAEAPVGMVFRRGPSKLVRVIHWDRATDKFTPLQWFRGRIFADRSDLSPDGQHMIYFAMGGVAWAIPKTRGSWTAI